MSRPVANVVAKGLIRYDGLRLEFVEINKEIELLRSKLSIKDQVILTQTEKIENLNTILNKKDEQFGLEREKSLELESELKKQNRNLKMYKILSIIGGAATLILIK